MYFFKQRFLDGVGTVERKLLDQLDGNLAFHRSVGMAFDDDSRAAELSGELGDLFEHVLDIRVVALLDRFPVDRLRVTVFIGSQLLG